MNREQKAAVIEEVAEQIRRAETIYAVDFRGLSVKDAAELRARLDEAGATFRVVKNRLTLRAAEKAGAEPLKEVLDGPTAFAFVRDDGDAALAAKALAQFGQRVEALRFKGGQMGAEALAVEQIESISRLPARDVLSGQFVGVLASPLTTLVRGLSSLIGGLGVQLQQIAEQGLVGGAEQQPSEDEQEPSEAPGAATAEAEAAEEETAQSETPSEGEQTEEKEG